jgi:hypothetical protein
VLILAAGLLAAGAAAQSPPLPSPSPQTSASADRPNLSGRWRFDADKSDDARQKMREAAGGRRPGGEGGGFGGRGGGGFGGRRGGGGGGGGRGRGGDGRGGDGARPDGGGEGSMRSLFEPASEISITQTETEFTVLEKDGPLRVLHADDKKYKDDATGTEVKTRWDKDRLLVETKRERGDTVHETWRLSLAEATRRLTVDYRLENPYFGTVTVRRVYGPAEAE